MTKEEFITQITLHDNHFIKKEKDFTSDQIEWLKDIKSQHIESVEKYKMYETYKQISVIQKLASHYDHNASPDKEEIDKLQKQITALFDAQFVSSREEQ